MAAFHDTTLDYVLSSEKIIINHVNNAGYTALMFAVWNEKFENAEKLIEFRATPGGFNYNGNSIPSIYDFLVNDRFFEEGRARKTYEMLLKLESVSRDPESKVMTN